VKGNKLVVGGEDGWRKEILLDESSNFVLELKEFTEINMLLFVMLYSTLMLHS
jgi:hypothetical protein